MLLQIWLLPILLIISATFIALPLSLYLVFILDGKYTPLTCFKWFEVKLNSGPQHWKHYCASILIFSIVLYMFSFFILSFQAFLPLNPDAKTLLAPNSILHTAISFLTNTDLQHYAGEKYFSNFTQLFFGITNFFLSAAIGLCALTAMIRALRHDKDVGNFFLDMWRSVIYVFLPIALILGVMFIWQGSPMTFQTSHNIINIENTPQTIAIGPVAAFEAIKMLGSNGGGFFNMNAAHPYENPTALSNFINMLAMMMLPFAAVFMYGKMLNRKMHSYVIFAVMLLLFSINIISTVYFDTLKPNPAFTAHSARIFSMLDNGNKTTVTLPDISPLPINQHLGNLEGKEMRFGISAGATYAAITTAVTNGSINAEADSLNPLAALSPMMGMWVNCIFGSVGTGMMNMFLYIIIGIFIAGMMVGRTPEYLGKKISAREMKLVIIALLLHPIMILLPTGFFAATSYGLDVTNNPGAHGLSQILYQFTSASANNGSAFNGLNITSGFWNHLQSSYGFIWDIVTALIMLFNRYLPIIATLALAAYLGEKRASPLGLGTLRDDTLTFYFLLLGTIFIIGALLYLPIATLGPIAEHLGPMPFINK